MSTLEIFLKLLRIALWQTPEKLPEKMSEHMTLNVMRGAEEQAITGLVLGTLLQQPVAIPEKQHMQCLVLLTKLKQTNEDLNEGVRLLTELFDEKNIDYVIVKGQAVGAYYPTPEMRVGGDIDYYCDEQNLPMAQKTVRETWGVDDSQCIANHHVQYEYKGLIYEGHFSLTSFFCKKNNRYWQQLVDHDEGCIVVIGGREVKTLSPTIHTVLVFVHLFGHILQQGIGLRQFCDLAVLLHYCHEDIDYERLREILQRLGMERPYRAIGSILIDFIGMPKEDLGYEPIDKDRKYVERLKDIVLSRGNMGHVNLRYPNVGWKHSLELATIKIIHFFKLAPLAPAYSIRWMWYELIKKFI